MKESTNTINVGTVQANPRFDKGKLDNRLLRVGMFTPILGNVSIILIVKAVYTAYFIIILFFITLSNNVVNINVIATGYSMHKTGTASTTIFSTPREPTNMLIKLIVIALNL